MLQPDTGMPVEDKIATMKYPHKFIFLLLLLFPVLLHAQKKEDSRTVELLDSPRIAGTKMVTLIDNERFLVLASYESVCLSFADQIRSNPGQDMDIALFKAIRSDSAAKMIHADQIARELKIFGRLEYRTGELLGTGNCFILNKKTGNREKNIRVMAYSNSAAVGKKYYINEDMILHNIEMIID